MAISIDWLRLRTSYAQWWLAGGLLVQTSLGLAAYVSPVGSGWTLRAAALAASMALLLISAALMHGFDIQCRGLGFAHTYARRLEDPFGLRPAARAREDRNGSHNPTPDAFVGSVLTVESIRAAMVVGLLAAIFSQQRSYIPAGQPGDLPLRDILASPLAVFFYFIVGALGSSLVTTMAALLCYEYAVRFTWKDTSTQTTLLAKGFTLGTYGFYALMWSLAVLPVLLDAYLGLLSITFVYFVMWSYYFFRRPSVPAARAPVDAAARAKNVTAGEPRPPAPSA